VSLLFPKDKAPPRRQYEVTYIKTSTTVQLWM